jgi:hypothetical protein
VLSPSCVRVLVAGSQHACVHRMLSVNSYIELAVLSNCYCQLVCNGNATQQSRSDLLKLCVKIVEAHIHYIAFWLSPVRC